MLKRIFLVILVWSTSGARADSRCGEILLATQREIREWQRNVDVKQPGFATSTPYRRLLDHTQVRLKTLGMDSKIVSLRIEKVLRPVVKITEINPTNINGKIMSRARQRFGTQFFIDPMLNAVGVGQGEQDYDERTIVLDLNQVEKRFRNACGVLLHEIRHTHLDSHPRNGVDDPHQGDLTAVGKYRLERSGFYDDYICLQELGNYARDARLSFQRFRLGEESRTRTITDFKNLRRVAKMIGKHLAMVEDSIPLSEIDFESGEDFSGVSINYPVFDSDNNHIAEIEIDIPGYTRPFDRRLLRSLVVSKMKVLELESYRMMEYVDRGMKSLHER